MIFIAGTITIIFPLSIIKTVQADIPHYGLDNYKSGYGYNYDDNNNYQKKSSDINIQNIECVNININVNELDITQLPQETNGLATAAAANKEANSPNIQNDKGFGDRINFDKKFCKYLYK